MTKKDKKKAEDEVLAEEPAVEENAPAEDKADGQAEKTEKTEKTEKEEKAEEPPAEPTELEKARDAAEEYKRKWYAVAAEYDNYRKRTQTQASQAYQDGKAEAILKLLPVADTFGYAYDGATDEKTRNGIDKIIKSFNTILASMGVEEIPLSVGDEFDESVAEAVMNVAAEDGEQPNRIKLILKKGYRREGKVIRFAQVSVTI